MCQRYYICSKKVSRSSMRFSSLFLTHFLSFIYLYTFGKECQSLTFSGQYFSYLVHLYSTFSSFSVEFHQYYHILVLVVFHFGSCQGNHYGSNIPQFQYKLIFVKQNSECVIPLFKNSQ